MTHRTNMPLEPPEEHRADDGDLTRRDLLLKGGLAVGAVTFGPLLAVSGAAAGPRVAAAAPAGVRQAQAILKGFRGPTPWIAPGPPFDAKKARGKSIFYLPGGFAPVINTILNGMREATAAVGLSPPPTFDPKGLPAEFNRGVELAIGRKVDCLIIEGIDPHLIEAPIKKAHAAGMKIISVDSRDESFKPPFPEVDQTIALPYYKAGRLIADSIIVDSNGKGDVLLVNLAGFPVSEDVAKAARDEFARRAPGLKVKTLNITFPDVPQLGTRTRVQLTQNPNLSYIAVTFDFLALSVVPAVHQAGAADRIKLSTFNASPPIMKWLKQKDVVAFEVGNSNKWHGWAQIDAALRLLTDTAPSKGEMIRLRVFDSTNIDPINVNAAEETWFGQGFPTQFRDGFKKLWMVA